MAHKKRFFAKLDENNTVTQVIVGNSHGWCKRCSPGNWRETFRKNPKQSFAGIGDVWNEEVKDFIAPSPYPSWILDENGQWQPPVPKPESSTDEYVWNESREKWIRKSEYNS